jgi:hypothetical protein
LWQRRSRPVVQDEAGRALPRLLYGSAARNQKAVRTRKVKAAK